MTNIKNFIKKQNSKKFIFTPGPGSLLEENLMGLTPCFGRGDDDYEKMERKVLNKLKSMSGHKQIARMQGSGSLAIEIMCHNFLSGNILIIDTGFYSDRLIKMCDGAKKIEKKITNIDTINWKNLNNIKTKYNWLLACPTETSKGLLLPIKFIRKLAKKIKAKIMLDATASFGLEKNHNLADVISYSSCKGLFGLTGASFVAYNKKPNFSSKTFYLNINNHLEKKMTGPYHTIGSLFYVLKKHSHFKKTVEINKKVFLKKMKNYLIYPKKNQPLLCTYIDRKIKSKNLKSILYQPRLQTTGSLVCHLGETYLKKRAKGKILNFLEIS